MAEVVPALATFPKLPFITAKQLGEMLPDEPEAVIQGIAIKGAITDLPAKVKAGKTTFTLHMVKKALSGEPFMGRTTVKCSVLYLTEEREATFRAALARVGLLEEENLYILHRHKVLNMAWPAVARLATQMAEEVGAQLVVVDTLSRWAKIEGDNEQSSGHAAAAMAPLEEMASKGIAVIQARHDSKGEMRSDPSDAGRGSSAFAGSADIIINLARVDHNGHPNRRQLRAISRFDDLPGELLIDLTEDGYVEIAAVESEAAREAILKMIHASPFGVTEKFLIEQTAMPRSTVRDALDYLAGTLQVTREKKGRAYSYSTFMGL